MLLMFFILFFFVPLNPYKIIQSFLVKFILQVQQIFSLSVRYVASFLFVCVIH
jgi:hypothetical protein